MIEAVDTKFQYVRKREKSIPNRNTPVIIEKIRTVKEMNSKFWIEPFLKDKNTPSVEMKLDNTSIESTIDTGATRVMMTSTMASKLWGKYYRTKLQKYPNRRVQDAQGNPVQVEGFKISKGIGTDPQMCGNTQ